MPNTNEENKNARSETGWERVWDEIKTSWKRDWDEIKKLISEYKAATGLVLYLYFSAVGYVYDDVYYSHYGLDVLKYERPEDFIFSIFHHGALSITTSLTIFLTIISLTLFGDLLEKLRQRLQAGNGQNDSDNAKSEESGKPEGKQVPDKEQSKKGDVGGIYHQGKMIWRILQKMFGRILQKILKFKMFILVVVAFMGPFWGASFLAQKNVADGSKNSAKGRLYTVNPNRHLDDAIHIGSTADYMIFLKNDKNNKNNAAGVSHGSPNSQESDGSNRVHNSDDQEERDIWTWLSYNVISAWAEASLTLPSDKIKQCLLNWCAQFDREKGFVFVVPTSNVASFDVEIKDRTVSKGTKDESSDKRPKDQTLDNLWIPDAENRSFPESYLFIGPDTQSTYPQIIPYVVVDPRKYKNPGIKAPLVYSLPYIKPGESELEHRQEEWLRQFYKSARACSGENRRVRIP